MSEDKEEIPYREETKIVTDLKSRIFELEAIKKWYEERERYRLFNSKTWWDDFKECLYAAAAMSVLATGVTTIIANMKVIINWIF